MSPRVFTAAFSALILGTSTAAQAAQLSFSGKVRLTNLAQQPVADTRIVVTFHGHESGIHEYTTDRTATAYTDADGNFAVSVKLSEYRYRWTHTTVDIAPTDISKAARLMAPCRDDGHGGCSGTKTFQVSPLSDRLAQFLGLVSSLSASTSAAGQPRVAISASHLPYSHLPYN